MNTVTVTNEAIEKVSQGTDPQWRESALDALYKCACQNNTFTVDEVWAFLSEKTRENRAMGAIMRRGVKLNWIEPTGEFVLSSQIQCHRGPRTLWRSLINLDPRT